MAILITMVSPWVLPTRLNPNMSVFAGVRAVYATGSYYGYVRNIQVGNMPLYKVLDPTKTNSGDIEPEL